MARAYLDHAATSPVRPAVRQAVIEALDLPGNPSSVHAEGRAARARLEQARQRARAAIGVGDAGALIFTSGATEANATALAGSPRTLASAVEHPSILAQPNVETVPVDAAGRLDLAALEALLAQGGVGCVALMAGEQRDRGAPTGSRGGPAGARGGCHAARRCGPGDGQGDPRRAGAGLRQPRALGPQDRRAEGDGRTLAQGSGPADAPASRVAARSPCIGPAPKASPAF